MYQTVKVEEKVKPMKKVKKRVKKKMKKKEKKEEQGKKSNTSLKPLQDIGSDFLQKIPSMTSQESQPSLDLIEAGISSSSGKEQEIELLRLKNYIDTEWGLPAVTLTLRSLYRGNTIYIPLPERWHIAQSLKNEIESLVYNQVQTESFIDSIWPSIKMLLGPDVSNLVWAAEIATVLAYVNLIRIIPIVQEATEDAETKWGK